MIEVNKVEKINSKGFNDPVSVTNHYFETEDGDSVSDVSIREYEYEYTKEYILFAGGVAGLPLKRAQLDTLLQLLELVLKENN